MMDEAIHIIHAHRLELVRLAGGAGIGNEQEQLREEKLFYRLWLISQGLKERRNR